jgi:hypothetical protein
MWQSPRLEMYEEGEADDTRHLELDLVEEVRCNLQGIHRYHNRNVQQRSFNVGDMVLCRIQDESGLHKLNSRWKGPFIMLKVTGPESYRLRYPDGQEVPNS